MPSSLRVDAQRMPAAKLLLETRGTDAYGKGTGKSNREVLAVRRTSQLLLASNVRSKVDTLDAITDLPAASDAFPSSKDGKDTHRR